MPSQWPGGVRPKGVVPVPVVVGGSRTIEEYHLKTICRYLDKRVAWFDDVVLYHGGQVSIDEKTGAKFGADFLADLWGQYHWYERKIFHVLKEDWDEHGKAAGPIRNREMVKAASREHTDTIAVFFMMAGKDTPGTLDCIAHAGKYLGWDRVFVKRLSR